MTYESIDDSVRIPYGELNGELVHISNVPSGLKCNCTCPECGNPLVARKGEIRQHYFAHHNPSIFCEHAFETTLHRWVKERIQDKMCLMLPGYDSWNADGGIISKSRPSLVHFEEVQAEKKKGSIRPDLTCFAEQTFIYVEIRVSHKVGPGKAEQVAKSGVPTLEIDLGLIGTKFDEQEIDRLLFESSECSKWIYHPEESKAKRKKEAYDKVYRKKQVKQDVEGPPTKRNEPKEQLVRPASSEKSKSISAYPEGAICRYCGSLTTDWTVYYCGEGKCICRDCLPAHNDRTEAKRRLGYVPDEVGY